MIRHAFAAEIRPGCFNEFRRTLGRVWPDAAATLDRYGVKNFSLWTVDSIVFGYYESPSDEEETDVSVELSGGRALLGPSFQREIDEDTAEAVLEILQPFGGLVDWISDPVHDMRLMYHDFGVVRENKELIRHRVFVTRLKGAYEEEYKHRHDGLVETRGTVIDPGPDSNFSIWNAGGYIFGYDEIDVTMEREQTAGGRKSTIDWETRMLEIMEWCTDDVDWIPREHHSHITRLAYHS